MKLARGTEYGIPRVRVVERCVGCPYYNFADPKPGLRPMVTCRATGRALTREALPLPGWCPLPDADGSDEAYTGELEVTSTDVITKMAQIRLYCESVQDYVGAGYPGEHDMIRADDALLFALIQQAGVFIAQACRMLNITDVAVIWDIMAGVKPAQPKLSDEHLCPKCMITRLDESGYCSKCDQKFTIM